MSTSHNAVAHAWAHQTGRNRKGFNMYYEGDTIYSYGRHFPIARLVTNQHPQTGDGPIALQTTRRYSVSTAKHKSIVDRACHHLTTFDVDDVLADSPARHEANYEGMLKLAADCIEKAKRSRKYGDMLLSDAMRHLGDARQYSENFGLGHDVVTLESLGVNVADIERRVEEAKAAEAERKRLADIEYARKNRDLIRQWLRGDSDYAPRTMRPMVRVKGDMVQTSWGAAIPLEAALRVYRIAKAHRPSSGNELHVFNVGPYGDAFVNEHGTIRVGCHTIPFRYAKVAACLAGLDTADALETNHV